MACYVPKILLKSCVCVYINSFMLCNSYTCIIHYYHHIIHEKIEELAKNYTTRLW